MTKDGKMGVKFNNEMLSEKGFIHSIYYLKHSASTLGRVIFLSLKYIADMKMVRTAKIFSM